jgi:hypothetical protein
MPKNQFVEFTAGKAAKSVQTISLYFKEGSSDKEYHASIDPRDGGYVVNFAYGRRGTTRRRTRPLT